MRKAITVVISLFLFLSVCSAEGTDLSGMSYDELTALKQAVDSELLTRPESLNSVLLPGAYEVGKDVKAGTYYILFDKAYDVFMTADIFIYKDKTTFDEGYSAYSKSKVQFSVDVYTGGDSARIDLADGNMLVIENGSVRISTVDFDETVKSVAVLPENVKEVPIGNYIVGKDIAAGRFNAFVEGRSGAEIQIYANEETYKEDENGRSSKAEYAFGITRGEGRQVTFTLEEGNVFIVSEGPVYMNKAQSDMITFE